MNNKQKVSKVTYSIATYPETARGSLYTKTHTARTRVFLHILFQYCCDVKYIAGKAYYKE